MGDGGGSLSQKIRRQKSYLGQLLSPYPLPYCVRRQVAPWMARGVARHRVALRVEVISRLWVLWMEGFGEGQPGPMTTCSWGCRLEEEGARVLRAFRSCRVREASSRPRREFKPRPREPFDLGEPEQPNGGFSCTPAPKITGSQTP